ncbi:lipocalin-like domain-containing protein [Pedobacter steynii]|uniref:Uncharacterized protein n=1 Tax=Pedobacter steynii TaxID=430522 RepID=A0A1D7QFR7_9SPHI|nr:lipocalin-like domain-containing protein [Pedobacter steynii]AOM77503.1 hypothetical protein BFS30_10185 [Pedobacter steynii]
MNLKISALLVTSVLLPALKFLNNEQPKNVPIKGTWQLVSGITIQKGDTTFTDYRKGMKQIKIINDTHFAFLNHDLKMGKDTASIFVAGGGRYTLKGDEYTEHLEYCNYREWENKTFVFKVKLKNDTLTQQGIEKDEKIGVDREIIEKYIKLKD